MPVLWDLILKNANYMWPILSKIYPESSKFPVGLAVRELFAPLIEHAICGTTSQGTVEFPNVSFGLDPKVSLHHFLIHNFVQELKNSIKTQLDQMNLLTPTNFVVRRQLMHANMEMDKIEPISFFKKLRENIQLEIQYLSALLSGESIKENLSLNEMDQFEETVNQIQQQFAQLKQYNSRWPRVDLISLQAPVDMNSLFERTTQTLDKLAYKVKMINQNPQSSFSSNTHVQMKNIQNLIMKVVAASFHFKEGPELVVMKKGHPRVNVSFLLGNYLTLRNFETTVSNLYIIDESMTKTLHKNGKLLSISYTNKANPKKLEKVFKDNKANVTKNGGCTGSYECIFNKPAIKIGIRDVNMSEGSIIASAKSAGVMEQKFCFAAQITLQFQQFDDNFEMWTTSVPFTFASHESQVPAGIATTFWDYCTASLNRNPFEVPNEMNWDAFIENLSEFFKFNLEKGLTTQQKESIYHKVFNCAYTPNTILQDKKFLSFSKWLFSSYLTLKSDVHDHQLREFWKKDLIAAFISKAEAEQKLMDRELGTFLLRFSDSVFGAISISCVVLLENSSHPQILHLNPFPKDDLTSGRRTSLSHKILNLKPKLTFLESSKGKIEDLLASIKTQGKYAKETPINPSYVHVEEDLAIKLPNNHSASVAESPMTRPDSSSSPSDDESSMYLKIDPPLYTDATLEVSPENIVAGPQYQLYQLPNISTLVDKTIPFHQTPTTEMFSAMQQFHENSATNYNVNS